MLTSLVLHPSYEIRNLIKSALEPFDIKAVLEASLTGGMERVRSLNELDLIMVSLRYDRALISNWLKVSKATRNGRYSVYGALVSKEDRVSSWYSTFVNSHFDIDFFESLSEESFKAYKPSLDKLVKERKDKRISDWLTSQTSRIIEIVDSLAVLASEGSNFTSTYNWRFLESLKIQIINSSPEVKLVYLDNLKSGLMSKVINTRKTNESKQNQQFLIKRER